jgi:hypothetical protein
MAKLVDKLRDQYARAINRTFTATNSLEDIRDACSEKSLAGVAFYEFWFTEPVAPETLRILHEVDGFSVSVEKSLASDYGCPNQRHRDTWGTRITGWAIAATT